MHWSRLAGQAVVLQTHVIGVSEVLCLYTRRTAWPGKISAASYMSRIITPALNADLPFL